MDSDLLVFPESAYSPSADSSPAESRSKYSLEDLPPQSMVFPRDDRKGFWTVVGVEGVMAPTSTSPDLEVRNVSQSFELPNGTRALVPTSSSTSFVEFVKMDDGWKRIRRAGDSVNVRLTGQQVGKPGFGDFLEVQQPASYSRGGQIHPGSEVPTISLGIPLLLAEDGVFEDSDVLTFEDDGKATRKMSIVVQVIISTGATVTLKSRQFTAWTNGKSITRGALAKHGATAVVELMVREKRNGSPLCVNDMEIDRDDLLLVELKQVSGGSLRAAIAVRDFQGLP